MLYVSQWSTVQSYHQLLVYLQEWSSFCDLILFELSTFSHLPFARAVRRYQTIPKRVPWCGVAGYLSHVPVRHRSSSNTSSPRDGKRMAACGMMAASWNIFRGGQEVAGYSEDLCHLFVTSQSCVEFNSRLHFGVDTNEVHFPMFILCGGLDAQLVVCISHLFNPTATDGLDLADWVGAPRDKVSCYHSEYCHFKLHIDVEFYVLSPMKRKDATSCWEVLIDRTFCSFMPWSECNCTFLRTIIGLEIQTYPGGGKVSAIQPKVVKDR